jgi:hypothetical protein
LLCRWKNSSVAARVFGDLQIFCCLLLKFQLPVIIRRSFCSSLSRLLCNLLMMFFFWVLWVLGLDELWSSSLMNRCCFAAQFVITFQVQDFQELWGWWLVRSWTYWQLFFFFLSVACCFLLRLWTLSSNKKQEQVTETSFSQQETRASFLMWKNFCGRR